MQTPVYNPLRTNNAGAGYVVTLGTDAPGYSSFDSLRRGV